MSITTEHLKGVYTREDAKVLTNIEPTPITPPFSGPETEKATNTLKSNRSAGIDELKAEQLKYGLSVAYDEIAEIFNWRISRRYYGGYFCTCNQPWQVERTYDKP